MNNAIVIERATLEQAPAIAAIYAHHVLNTTATFEIVPPTGDEMALRLERVLSAGWPWLVAREMGGGIVGYAYAAQFGERAAYRFCCENSIYIRHDRFGLGIGKALLDALIEAAESCGFRQMIALIAAVPGSSPASLGLHTRAGFAPSGKISGAGRKQGQWIDIHYLQRALGAGNHLPPVEEPDR